MPEQLLTVLPPTRIHDLFIGPGSDLDSTWPEKNYRDSIIQGTPNRHHRCQADFYEKIGIDIVVETAMHYPYNFITEKTYRPLANGRPFIILGPAHTLAFLKSLGFMTFSSIIDETYDEINDPEARFDAVCTAVKHFVDRDTESVIEDIRGVESLLIHNQKTLVQLAPLQLQSLQEAIKN